MDAAGRGTAVSPVEIRHRTIPERLAWLAARLREEKDWREPVALALDVLAGEVAEQAAKPSA